MRSRLVPAFVAAVVLGLFAAASAYIRICTRAFRSAAAAHGPGSWYGRR
ncbi:MULTISPECIES: hypothetical protein [unclassified Nocardia]|nr:MULTISPECIES: hypothetical protein [unclassified Nocardia]